MMKKGIKRFAATILASVMVFGATMFTNVNQVEASRLDAPEKYTFRDPSTTPKSFNPHDIEGSYAAVTSYRWYLSTPFAERVVAPEGSDTFWEWKHWAAVDYTDITAEFADKAKYGVPANAMEGYVWVINIRDDMKWHDGTPIDAESYVRSTYHRLNPEMFAGASTGGFGDAVIANGRAFYNGEVDFEDVGIFASDEYQLTFVLEVPLIGDDRYKIDGAWMLVHEDLYTDGLEKRENLLATNYMTTLETMASSGPYMIVSYEFDKQVVFERNPHWFGWFDEEFDDFWMMTDIVLDRIPEPETQELIFNQGLLDRIRLNMNNFSKYRFSDYLIQYMSTNNYRYSFNSDLKKLEAIEKNMNDGFNRRVLSIHEFRKGMSYALDRVAFNQQTSAGWMPAITLIDGYYYDIYNDGAYRDSEHAMEAIVELYGFNYGKDTPYATLTDAYEAITGFNLETARELFQEAYEIAIKDGIYKDGEKIHINVYASSGALSAAAVRGSELFASMLAEAVVGTGFEGNLTLSYVGNYADFSAAISKGEIEAIATAWGGGMENPFNIIGAYTDVSTNGRSILDIREASGWDPSVETLTLSYDFFQIGNKIDITMTFDEWHRTITGSGVFTKRELLDTRLFILAYMEAGVLAAYQAIPYGQQQVSELRSMKVEIPEPIHPIFFEYTPRSQLKFNYTDAEWAEFIKSNGGTLNYE